MKCWFALLNSNRRVEVENKMVNHNLMLGIVVLFLVACTTNSQEKGTIVINNNSDYLLSDIEVRYISAKRVDVLGDLSSHTSYTYEIHYTDAEDSIDLNYTDHRQVNHSQNVEPYAGKYDKKRYVIDIN